MMRLEVRDLSLQVLLGCIPGEQKTPQEILVSLELRFPEPVAACQTDRLTDTVCYDELCKALKTRATEKPYNTIEHLAYTFSKTLKTYIPAATQIRVRVHKKPAIPGLLGGAICEIEGA